MAPRALQLEDQAWEKVLGRAIRPLAALAVSHYIGRMDACEILLDTNVALHFPRFDQIDWPTLSQCKACTIVITPILLRELEQKKIFGATLALKERAGRTIDFLLGKMSEADPIEVRPGVTLVFIESEPAIDFASHQLIREVNDDHYIASALERQASTGRSTIIASSDGGMALKLRSRPISILRLPEELRLPFEPDPRDKELREARKQLLQMQTQRPKLAVTFAGGTRKREIKNARSMPTHATPLAEIKAEHSPLPVPTRGGDTPFSGDIAALGALRGAFAVGSANVVARYNAALPEYYAEYASHVEAMDAWLERLRLSATIAVELHNDGSATATDVDVTLRFPADVTVCRRRDFPDQPKPPRPPRKPGETSLGDAFSQDLTFTPPFSLQVHDGAIHVDERARTVSFSAKSLKQRCMLDADKFILTRPAGMTGGGIEVEVEITLHEAEPVHQKLAITFAETEAAASDD